MIKAVLVPTAVLIDREKAIPHAGTGLFFYIGKVMTFANIVSLLGLAQGILLGGFILLAHRRDRPAYFLGAFILTLSLRILPFLLIRLPFGAAHPSILYLPLYFWFLGMPLLYLYCRRLTGLFTWKKDGIHLLPGALEFIALSILYALDVSGKQPLFSPEIQRGIIGTITILAIGPAAYYSYLILRLLERHRDYLLSYYSNLTDRKLGWIRHTLFALIGFAVVYTLMVYGPLPVNPKIRITFGAVTNTLIVYYVALHGIRQLGTRLRASPEAGAVSDHERIFREIGQYLESTKAYLDPNLTLFDLGKRVQQSERNLSRIINTGSGQNFNTYINHYRIRAARRMLSDPGYDHFTMEGIAAEAGFNTKTTFYQAFKRENELSPAAYRRHRGEMSEAD